jgi:hypothetical protein
MYETGMAQNNQSTHNVYYVRFLAPKLHGEQQVAAPHD